MNRVLRLVPVSALDELAQPFNEAARRLVQRMIAQDLPMRVFETRRGLVRQNQLFASGRDGHGKLVNRALWRTNARAGESAHNWGLAIDCILVTTPSLWRPKQVPTGPWDNGRDERGKVVRADVAAVWESYGAAARALALTWGGDWPQKDLAHVELTGWQEHRPRGWQAIVDLEIRAANDDHE